MRGSLGVVLTTELEAVDGGVRVVTRIRRPCGRERVGLMPSRIPTTKRLPIAAA